MAKKAEEQNKSIRQMLMDAYRESDGNQKRAGELLGVSQGTFSTWCKFAGLTRALVPVDAPTTEHAVQEMAS